MFSLSLFSLDSLSLKTLKELRLSCQSADGKDDQSKGSLLLEIFALEIQMYSQTNDTKKLRVSSAYDITILLISS